MKALLISDIHSNIFAMEAIWAAERDSEAIYCAGDLVDYGLWPNEVIAWVREHRAVCVQGNHDAWVAACYRAGLTLDRVPPSERGWVNVNVSRISAENVAFLEALPRAVAFELDGATYGMTHMYREYDEILNLHAFESFRREVFPQARPDQLIFGHTHRPAVRVLSDTLRWINPGSVSYRRPDDPDQTAHYMTIVDGVVHFHRLAYDLAPIERAVRQQRLSDDEMRVALRYFGPRDE